MTKKRRDVTFRRIRGRIVPIRKKKSKTGKYISTATAISGGGIVASSKISGKLSKMAKLKRKDVAEAVKSAGWYDDLAKTREIKPEMLTKKGALKKKYAKKITHFSPSSQALKTKIKAMDIKAKKLKALRGGIYQSTSAVGGFLAAVGASHAYNKMGKEGEDRNELIGHGIGLGTGTVWYKGHRMLHGKAAMGISLRRQVKREVSRNIPKLKKLGTAFLKKKVGLR